MILYFKMVVLLFVNIFNFECLLENINLDMKKKKLNIHKK